MYLPLHCNEGNTQVVLSSCESSSSISCPSSTLGCCLRAVIKKYRHRRSRKGGHGRCHAKALTVSHKHAGKERESRAQLLSFWGPGRQLLLLSIAYEHGCNPHKLPSEHPHSGRPSCWLQIPPTALKATHGNSPLGVCGISTAWRCLLSLCGLLQLIG